MKNKKAIEALVATVLLVLIAIAAVGIIWGAVMPIIKKNIQSSQSCFDAGLTVNKELGQTYITGTNISIQISRGPSKVTLAGISIKVIDNTGNSNLTTCNNVPSPNAESVCWVDYNSTLGLKGKPQVIGIAPIIALGAINSTRPMQEYEI